MKPLLGFFSKRFVLVFSFHFVTFNMERLFKLCIKPPFIFLAKLGPINVSLGRAAVVKKKKKNLHAGLEPLQ